MGDLFILCVFRKTHSSSSACLLSISVPSSVLTPPILPGKSAAAWSASTMTYILTCVPSGAGKSLSRFGYHRRQILRQGLSAGSLRGFFEKAGVREWGQSEEKGHWIAGDAVGTQAQSHWRSSEEPWRMFPGTAPLPENGKMEAFIHLLSFSFVCLSVCFGSHWAAFGISVPNQGLNPVPRQ